MTLSEFVTKYKGKAVDTDEFPKAQPYQCHDLAKVYCQEVVGCSDLPTKTGEAKGVYLYFLDPLPKYFTKIAYPTTIKDGDIIVWGDGNQTGSDGHIGVAYQGKVFNQNNAGRAYATLDNIFTSGLLGVLRPKKGTDMVTDKTQLSKMYLALLHRSRGSGEGEDVYLSKDSGWVFNDIYNSKERAKVLANEKAAIVSYKSQIAGYKEDVSGLKEDIAQLDADKADLEKQVIDLQAVIDSTEVSTGINFDDLSLGELLSQAFKKLFKIK